MFISIIVRKSLEKLEIFVKQALSSEHKEFFHRTGYIELENVLSPEEVELLSAEIHSTIKKRRALPSYNLASISTDIPFLLGHDLYSDSAPIKKIVTKRLFSETAAELFGCVPLQLAFDQFYPDRTTRPFAPKGIYHLFLEAPEVLEEITSIQGFVGAVIIALNGDSDETEGNSIFPRKPGSVVFIKPQCMLDWSPLFEHQEREFLMIGYTQNRSVYRMNTKDPHTHTLKGKGYVFGDLLKEKTHPIVLR